MTEDSTVRFPGALLSRAEKLDPERRSDIVREAAELGLQQLEQRRLLEHIDDVQALLHRMVESDPLLEMRIGEVAGKLLLPKGDGSANAVVSFLRVDEVAKQDEKNQPLPVFGVEAGELVDLVIPALHYCIYEPVDLRIHAEDPGANVRVSRLCSDEGAGQDLLMPGWHPVSHFDGAATALAKYEFVMSPKDMRLQVRTDKSTRVAVSLVMRVKKDDAFILQGVPRPGSLPLPQTAPVPRAPRVSGRFVRVPFEEHPSGWETKSVNWGVLRLLRPVFEWDDPRLTPPGCLVKTPWSDLLLTLLSDLKIGGSPHLLMDDNWSCAADFTVDRPSQLRAYPILISPNRAYVNLKHLDGGKPVVPYLVCEVMRDDAFLP